MADVLQDAASQKQQAEALNPASQPSYEAAQQNAQMVSAGITPVIPPEFKPPAGAPAPHPMDVGRQAQAAGVAPEAMNQLLSKAYDEYVHDQAVRNMTKFYPQLRPTQYWVAEEYLPNEAQVGFGPEDFPPQERIPELYPKPYSRMIPVPEGMTPEEAKVLQQQRDAELAAYTGTRLAGMLTWIPGYGELSQELLPEVKQFENEYYQTHSGGEIATADIAAMGLAAPAFSYTVGGLAMKTTYGVVRAGGTAALGAASKIPEVQEILTGANQVVSRVLRTKVATTGAKWISTIFPGVDEGTEGKAAREALEGRVKDTGGKFLASGEILLGPGTTPSKADEIAAMVKVLRSTVGREGTKVKLVKELEPAVRQAAGVAATSTVTGAALMGFDQGLRSRSWEGAVAGMKVGAAFGAGWGGFSGVRAGFQMASPSTVAAEPTPAAEPPVLLKMPKAAAGFSDPTFEAPPKTNFDRILQADRAGKTLGDLLTEGQTLTNLLKEKESMSPETRQQLQDRLVEVYKQSKYYQAKHEELSNDDYFRSR